MLIFTFSGTEVLLGLAGLCLLPVAVVLLLRLRRAPEDKSRGTHRRPGVFAHSSALRQLSLCLAIAAVLLAINYTTFAAAPEYAAYTVGEEDFDIVIPPTNHKPPPPPPPPPPPVAIEPVLEPEVEQEAFVDNSVTDDEPVAPVLLPDPPAAPAAAPPPPPPPPRKLHKDIVDVFVVVEKMPVFSSPCFELEGQEQRQCSDRALLTFVQSRIRYPALARENGIQGTVTVSFVVEKDGSISGIEAVRGVPAGCTEEALRAVQAITEEGVAFRPGMQGGRPVRVRYNLPVKFRLE